MITHVRQWLLGLDDHNNDYADVDCRDLHLLNSSSLQCAFVNATESCHITEGLIDYTVFVYCKFRVQLIPLAVTILFVWLMFLFVALAITADNFFCSALEVMAKTMRMSDNIAGVTLLAFGNGAPDLFSAGSAVAEMKNGDVGLVFGALLGAGVFTTTVVAGAVCLTGPFHLMKRPFLRDIIFYLVTVSATFAFCLDGKITLLESVFFLVAYVVYVFVVVIGRIINQRIKRQATPVIVYTVSYRRRSNNSQSGGEITIKQVETEGSLDEESEEPVIRETTEESLSNGITYEEPLCNGMNHEDSVGNGINYEEPLSNGINGHGPGHQLPSADTTALVTVRPRSPVVRRRDVLRTFLVAASPIDVDEWKSGGILARAYCIFKSPILFLVKLTIPVVNYNSPEHNWNKPLQVIQCILAPPFVIFAASTGVALTLVGGVCQVWILFLIFGCLLAVVVASTSSLHQAPVYHPVFAYAGFIVSVMWIKVITNEIVNILQTMGVVFNVSNAVFGLTFLAWGNCIGDMISDVAIARRGFPKTGLSACFAGPLFSTLLGVGIPFTIKSIADGQSTLIDFSDILLVIFCGLGVSIIFSIIVVPILKFNINRVYGIILICIYAVFLIFALLVETDVLTFDI